PPSLKVASSGRKRRRSRRRKRSKSWRSVPPMLRQSTTCRTVMGSAMGKLLGAGRHDRRLRAVEEPQRPQLQGHEAPDREGVMAADIEVLCDDGAYGAVVEPAALAEAAIAEHLLHRLLQRAAEPFHDGDAEASLAPRQDLGRQKIGDGALEDRL